MSRPSVTYINQLAYADVPYPTTLNPGDVLRERIPAWPGPAAACAASA